MAPINILVYKRFNVKGHLRATSIFDQKTLTGLVCPADIGRIAAMDT